MYLSYSLLNHDLKNHFDSGPIPYNALNLPEYPKIDNDDKRSLILGHNGTRVPYNEYMTMYMGDAISAARQLCSLIFGETTLATQTPTGKKSLRKSTSPSKGQLDPNKTADIISLVSSHFDVSSQYVSDAIVTICEDSARRLRYKMTRL